MGRKLKPVLPTPRLDAGRVALDAELVEGFVKTFLLRRFDSPRPIPPFHKEMWQLWCRPTAKVAIAAPRGHAKTTAGTHAFTLAALLFGFRDFGLLLSSTEHIAVSFLQDIRMELTENEDLIAAFNIHGLSKDNESEIVGHVGERAFKLVAKGAGQKLRGIKWRNKRPNLIIADDLEEDEEVASLDRREKLRKWFFNALLPIGSDDALLRVHGTILHEDSLLARLLENEEWLSKLYRAHNDFDDFTGVLWPEKFSEARLRAIRQGYINDGNPSGYSQEYLNKPIAAGTEFFSSSGFHPIEVESRARPKVHYAAIDFAISQKERADRTAIGVGGVDSENLIYVEDIRAGRWDALQIIEEMFQVQEDYAPEIFVAEAGTIEKVLGPFLNAEMIRRNRFLNILPKVPVKDKMSRASAWQARHRAGGIRYDTEAHWFPDLKHEMDSFPRGQHDDRVDALAWLGSIMDEMTPALSDGEAIEEGFLRMERADGGQGRSQVTGY